ncbi:MAG: GNAT family N-acetyltransferase [Deltaproteobacteria bacterium]|nr:GNAT family N-acetyltransferase [Deltaproteobacteria bacterium]
MKASGLTYREEVIAADQEAVRAIVKASGFFSDDEVAIAAELVEARLSEGEESGYYFLFAEQAGKVAGYTCFGPIPGSLHSYDLYWIAVANHLRQRGIGKDLLSRSEALIRKRGGSRIYIETSARPQYEKTVAFYLACGYRQEAFLEDFYAPGDSKIIFVKAL